MPRIGRSPTPVKWLAIDLHQFLVETAAEDRTAGHAYYLLVLNIFLFRKLLRGEKMYNLATASIICLTLQ